MMRNPMTAVAGAVIALVLAFAGTVGPAHAYVGPGPGLTVLGALWAVIAALVLAVIAIARWPLRYLIRKLRGHQQQPAQKQQEDPEQDSTDSK